MNKRGTIFEAPDYTSVRPRSPRREERAIIGRCKFSARLLRLLVVSLSVIGASQSASAQEPAPASRAVAAPPPVSTQPRRETHRFWDKENDWLFAGVGVSRALDYSSTLNFRRRGRQEILITNDVVDDHAGFAAVEAGATGLSIGVSYIFHHYGHHKLERYTSIVHMSLATTGAIRNYSLKTAHPVSFAASLRAPADSGLGTP